MPRGLKRYYGTGGLHFITCSCYRRQAMLGSPARRDLFLTVLESMRQRYRFVVVGYVVMPEHFHLLISEPEIGNPSTVMQAIKLGYARRVIDGLGEKPHFSQRTREMGHPPAERTPVHTWQRRFYDFNLWSQGKELEKIHYMHQNPVDRGLVARPEDWRWSSFLWYACGEKGSVLVNDWSHWKETIESRAV